MVKELGSRFAEVERRVRSLIEENARLRGRVLELEKEQGRLAEAARELESLRAKKAQVQDRLKRLLHVMESIEVKTGDTRGSEPSERSLS
jgi:regulator of replication initiation timing